MCNFIFFTLEFSFFYQHTSNWTHTVTLCFISNTHTLQVLYVKIWHPPIFCKLGVDGVFIFGRHSNLLISIQGYCKLLKCALIHTCMETHQLWPKYSKLQNHDVEWRTTYRNPLLLASRRFDSCWKWKHGSFLPRDKKKKKKHAAHHSGKRTTLMHTRTVAVEKVSGWLEQSMQIMFSTKQPQVSALWHTRESSYVWIRG